MELRDYARVAGPSVLDFHSSTSSLGLGHFLSYRILAENPVGKTGVRESVWIMRRSREMCPGLLLLSGTTGPFMLISYMVSLYIWFLYMVSLCMVSLYGFSLWSLYMVSLYGVST